MLTYRAAADEEFWWTNCNQSLPLPLVKPVAACMLGEESIKSCSNSAAIVTSASAHDSTGMRTTQSSVLLSRCVMTERCLSVSKCIHMICIQGSDSSHLSTKAMIGVFTRRVGGDSHDQFCPECSLKSSLPISMRLISEVPAPISYSFASLSNRPVGYSLI